jgi:D-2-hydroxyglutarate dehydrogenase
MERIIEEVKERKNKRKIKNLIRYYYTAANQHILQLKEILGNDQVLYQSEDIEKYTTDWLQSYHGGSVVCLPKTSEEVSKILSYCSKHKIGVVTQGGNTGLVGGSVGTNRNEVILSTQYLNRIIDIDVTSGILICESGCILEKINQELEKYNFIFPLDLGAKGSCMLGGNLATNAGGLRVIKYGSLHSNLLGLEVILANGEKLDMLRSLVKDNTGYPLKHLFIGSEGTLGVITKLSMKLSILPKSSQVLFATVEGFSKVCELLSIAKQSLSEQLSAFEFVDLQSLHAVNRTSPQLIKWCVINDIILVCTDELYN